MSRECTALRTSHTYQGYPRCYAVAHACQQYVESSPLSAACTWRNPEASTTPALPARMRHASARHSRLLIVVVRRTSYPPLHRGQRFGLAWAGRTPPGGSPPVVLHAGVGVNRMATSRDGRACSGSLRAGHSVWSAGTARTARCARRLSGGGQRELRRLALRGHSH